MSVCVRTREGGERYKAAWACSFLEDVHATHPSGSQGEGMAWQGRAGHGHPSQDDRPCFLLAGGG